MALGFLGKTSFWDGTEYVSAFAAAALSLVTASLEQQYKPYTAWPTFPFATFVCIAKFRSMRLGKKESAEKIARADEIHKSQTEALQNLRITLEAENAKREKELEILKASRMELAQRFSLTILETFHSLYFDKEAKQEAHKHRVTLFRCVEIDGDAGRIKHLEIFARKGVYPDSSRTWRLDDNDPDKCEGIAGRIWFHGAILVVTAACEWPADGNPVRVAEYAQSLSMSVDAAYALNVKSQTFTGAQVMVGDRRWGVLLLDSLKVGHITDTAAKKKLLNAFVEMLSVSLAKVLS